MREPTVGDVHDLLDADPMRAGAWIDVACSDIVRLEARRLGIEASSRQDVAQEAATRLLVRMRSKRPVPLTTALRAWVRGLVRRIVSEQRRRTRRRREALWSELPATRLARRLSDIAAALPTHREIADPDAPPPPRSANSAWARAALSRFSAEAGPDPCDLLLLRAAGRSHAEIAARLAISVNAVRLRLRRKFRESRDRPPLLRP